MKKNYFFNLLLSLSNILFPIISFPYVSKVVGPSGVGKVQFITSYAQYFGLIAALGIPVYGIREIAKAKHDRSKLNNVFSELSVIYFGTSLMLAVVYLASLFFIADFKSNPDLYLWSVLLVLLSFTSIDWFYEGLEQFRTVAIRSIVIRVFSLIAMFVLIHSGKDYHWYLLIIIFTTLSNNAVNMVRLHKSVSVKLKGLDLKRHLKPLFLIFSTTIATSMYTMLDTVLLGFLANTHAVGLYTAAVKLSKIALPIVTSLGMVLIPGLAKNLSLRNYNDVQVTLNRSFAFTAFFSIPIGFGLALLAPEFIVAFSSAKFLDATQAMQILAILPLTIGFGYLFGFQILVPDGKDKQMLFSVLGGVVTGLVLNFTLVPRLEHVGAAIANVVSEMVVTGFFIYFVKKLYTFTFSLRPLITAAASSLVFIPIILFCRAQYHNVYYLILTAVPACALFYILFQKLLFKEQLINEVIQPFVTNKFLSVKRSLSAKNPQIYG
ncbi:flippase [Mucilaginibacter sp. PAMB04274]|uniref:flippase n=1 Tax=Mucilaginibacter sp. PAMB04274 TaxID=3138568 RepID=UPI0031F704A6